MRKLLVILAASAFGLAALPADAALELKKTGKAAKPDAKKAAKAAPAEKRKKRGINLNDGK